MIKKRQTWCNDENEMLIKIINEANSSKVDSSLKWERVAAEMSKSGFQKSAKQCRERFFKELDPETKPGSVAREMGFRGKPEAVRTVPFQTEPLEGHLEGTGCPNRQRGQKPVLCADPQGTAQGLSVDRTHQQHFEDQHDQTQGAAGLL